MNRFLKFHPTETNAFADGSATVAVGIDPKGLGDNIQKDIKTMDQRSWIMVSHSIQENKSNIPY